MNIRRSEGGGWARRWWRAEQARIAASRRVGFRVRVWVLCFFFQAEDGIRDYKVTGVQTCALPIYSVHDDVLLVLDPRHMDEPHAEELVGRQWVERAEITPMEDGKHLRGEKRGDFAAEDRKSVV